MQHDWDKYFDTESDYWKKVQKIYEENDNYKKVVVSGRNLHHKFPRSFSKKDGVEIDNDEDNLVSLSLSSHFLVHFYLWKCCKKGYRLLMALAFQYMRRKAIKYASDETIEALAKDYENLMKDVSEAHKHLKLSEEARKKISESMKGKKHSEETKKKIGEKSKGRHWKHSEETKKKIGDASRGRPHTEENKRQISKTVKENISKIKKLYYEYKDNGGKLKWNDFQKEVKNKPFDDL